MYSRSGVVEVGRKCILNRGLWSLGGDVSEIGGRGVWEGMYPRSGMYPSAGVVEVGRGCIRIRIRSCTVPTSLHTTADSHLL